MRELGYVEGQYLFAGPEGKRRGLPSSAPSPPHRVFGTRQAPAAKNTYEQIPIVMTNANPVQNGFVTSLARPGGNVTGLDDLSGDLAGKAGVAEGYCSHAFASAGSCRDGKSDATQSERFRNRGAIVANPNTFRSAGTRGLKRKIQTPPRKRVRPPALAATGFPPRTKHLVE